MSEFLSVIFGFPTAVFTVLLIVVLFYWVLATFGLVDLGESGDAGDVGDVGHGHLHADGHTDDLGTLAGYLVAFGLNGVPISVVASLLVLVAWTISALSGIWFVRWVPTELLRWVAGAGVLVAASGLSLVITARLVRPLRGVFRTRYATTHASLVGQECVIWTSEVTPTVGRAEVSQHGAPLNIRIWADTPNPLKRGDKALIVEYDAAAKRYRVEALDA
ncbi:ubiquinone biosynthesis protein [Comamonas serinivorans]|uniref:Ubiquinone biosynthesis protein n=1 Tax=Comamonas serinivorans TaxID=1082851 RepID=A0A1Y0EKE8_9BURK|nr:ubiquinone biosynthesis protein [Comamonas serinivorans]ARU03762.1 ubiquinone biosynthesis protein [Comamonas serinivorans]